jgi:hypothetical protein
MRTVWPSTLIGEYKGGRIALTGGSITLQTDDAATA